ncbi:MAG: DNA polymerase III subunit alpha [Planctomycetota bacterium]
MPITPLHVRSGHSLLRGPATPERLVSRAAELGHTALALTDVNSLAGITAFWKLAVDGGLQPLIGAELLVRGHSAVALITSEAGYANLCELITAIHTKEEINLAALSDGLAVIVEDCSLAEPLLASGLPAGQLYWGIDPACQSHMQLRRLTDAAERFGLAVVATGKALMADADEHRVARLLTAMRLQTTDAAVPDGALPPRRAHLRSREELARQLVDWPEAVANNRRLVELCSEFKLLPRQPVFPAFECLDGLTPPAYLRQLCQKGIMWRYGDTQPDGVDARLQRELGLIESKGFCEYFLVVWDIVQYARTYGAPVAGRGSGASSLVAYLLGITNICPLECEVPFERFLNERREDFPDLDIDFCWRIRDDVINYAIRRWGEDHVAMVCTHGTFQDRSALRETAKAMGFSERQIANPDKFIDPHDTRAAELRTLSRRLVGLPHNFSVHPGGIVMAPGPIARVAPIQPATKGVCITQYDKDGVEDIGLVKLDLLGNRSLSTIRAACDIIGQQGERTVDPERMAHDDPATLATLRAGDTVGCNQLESPAMRHLLRAMRPGGFSDVMKALALIRPGAASIGMKEIFIRRHRGLEPTPSLDPRIDPILSGTRGVMLYEDDVMLLAAAMLGMTPAEGDRFRKAVQKCFDDEQRLALSHDFIHRCVARGFDRTLVDNLWVQMAKFNAYSFCRAHAASYAQLAWTVAYLKTYHPLAFWVGALNNNQSMYHPRVYVEQAKRMGIRFLPPDVNRSQQEFIVDGDAIRVGLNYVGGLGPAGIETILQARDAGPFTSLSDFLMRTSLGDTEARSLIVCGACDTFGVTRPALVMQLTLCLQAHPALPTGQACLLPAEPTLPHEPDDYTPARKAADQRRILGISIGPHVLAGYRGQLQRDVTVDSRHLADYVGKRVRIAGVLEAMRTAPAQNDGTVTFLTLDDEFGLFEGVIFHRGRRGLGINGYGPYILDGTVQDQYGTLTIMADSVSCWRNRKEAS